MFGRRRKFQDKEMALNITSLMDILTIVLIFLINSFSSDEQEISPPKEFRLPSSSSFRPVAIALKVTISKDDIRVEDKVVTKFRKGALRSSDLNSGKQVVPLLKELQRKKAEIRAGARKDSDEDEELIYFEAAKGTPYRLIDRVLKTAAGAGFTKFRLAVWKRG